MSEPVNEGGVWSKDSRGDMALEFSLEGLAAERFWEGFRVRPVAPDDLELVCSHRRRMFAEAGRPEQELAPMTVSFRAWLAPRLADGRYFGFVVEDGAEPVAGVGLFVLDWPPHFLHPESSERAYVLNVFVDPTHRGRGLATRLMELGEEECRRRGLQFMVLHASEMGRPVYEKLGWQVMPEMGKAI